MDNDLLLEDLLSQSAAAQKKEEKSKNDETKDNATWHSRSFIFPWEGADFWTI